MEKQPEIFRTMKRDNIEAYTPRYAVDIIIPYLNKMKEEKGGGVDSVSSILTRRT